MKIIVNKHEYAELVRACAKPRNSAACMEKSDEE